ncbi:outer membrane protein [Dysgonomonas sp. 520]|uniref:outer membrane protein n=1 Tax=Dysgonomonas sp. 520 TaxID=2302931 RepID=UPI0013D3EB9F|nr:porin family protein [Dysgonomonas sp. 520]NDW09752.1 hypothetical protein [Dysgonomonas sp. 520]
MIFDYRKLYHEIFKTTKINVLFCFLFVISFSACSPHIGRTITKTYSPLDEDSDVEVFFDKSSMPPSGIESLGVIDIKDAGVSTLCDSVSVLDYIKKEARQIGGDIIFISRHNKPELWGNGCHEMKGVIFRTIDGMSGLDQDSTNNITKRYTESNERKLPRFKVAASAGYGWRTAELAADIDHSQRSFCEKLMHAPVWDASVNYYFCDFWGLGLMYSAFSATADGSVGGLKGKGKSLITFAGPAFSIRSALHPKWILEGSFGVGYLGYKLNLDFPEHEEKYTGATVGIQYSLGTEYKFNKNWGLGLNLIGIGGALSKMKKNENGDKSTIKFDDKEMEGLQGIRLSMGIRYYIH